jgi:YggT family protein
MFSTFLGSFLNLFVFAFNILILIRVVMSWVQPVPAGVIGRFIFEVTEPVLAPIRAILPKSQMVDFSPLAAFVLLQVLQLLANGLLPGQ